MKRKTALFILLALILAMSVAVLLGSCNDKTWKVEFLVDGKTYYETTVTDGTVVNIPQINRTEDMTFNGWYLEGEIYREETVTVDRDMTFDAVWIRDYYDIYYVLYDGKNDIRNSKRFGRGTVEHLYDATRPGYTFLGWYLEGEKIEEITDATFKDSDAESITLFSKWEPAEYDIRLDARGGELNDKEITVTYGNVTDFPVPEKYGYTFAGWYNGYERVTDGKGKCLSAWSYTDVNELTANWEINTYLPGLSIYSSGTGYVLYRAFGEYESLTIPDYVTEIYEYAFNSNSNCKELLFAEGSKLTVVDDYAFYKSKIRSIVLPAGVVSIGDCAFMSCRDLESVTFEDGSKLDHIGNSAFEYCELLRSINIPDAVREIPAFAFRYCYSLYEFTVPEACVYISESAFGHCYALGSLTLSKNVGYIGKDAFLECYQLREIYNLSSLPLVAGDTAYGYVAYYATDIYDGAETVSRIVVDSDGFVFYDGSDGAVLLTAPKRNGELILPESCDGGGYVIGKKVFYYSGYTSVVIPDAVTEIGDGAFNFCESLATVTIGAGVTRIGKDAFLRCSALEKAEIATDGALTEIGKNAFAGCSLLTSFTVPVNVVNIGYDAFSGCVKLVTVCNLSSLNIVAGSDEYGGIAKHAVQVTTSLGEEGLYTTTKDGYVFFETESETVLTGYVGNAKVIELPETFNGKTYSIGGRAFYDSGVTSVSIPGGVKYIGDEAFMFCSDLSAVAISEGVERIGESAFLCCDKLVCVTIPASVTVVDYGAFDNCSSLKEVIFVQGSRLTSIEGRAFYSCSALERVVFDENSPLSEIGSEAFANDKNLLEFTLTRGVTSIKNSAFDGCIRLIQVRNLSALNVVAGATDNGGVAAYALNVYGESGSKLTQRGDYLFYDDGERVLLVKYDGSDAEIVLPEYDGKNYEVHAMAFDGNTTLVSVSIPSCVTKIGESAFEYCKALQSVSLTKGLVTIGKNAFYYCTALDSLFIPESVETIGDSAFRNCKLSQGLRFADGSKLKSIGKLAFYLTTVSSVTLPEGLEYIGERAFDPIHRLASIVLPSSIAELGNNAFGRENSYPEHIYFKGDESAWNSLVNGTDNADLPVYFYSAIAPAEEGNYWHYVNGVPTVW